MTDTVRLCRALALEVSEGGLRCNEAAKATGGTEQKMVYLIAGLTLAELSRALAETANVLEADQLDRLGRTGPVPRELQPEPPQSESRSD